MKALCVDDEPLLLRSLQKAVESSPDIKEAFAFGDEREALFWAENNPFDIAFLDIELTSMDGIELARKLKEIKPECSVVFCTGHSEYAMRAFGVHASGYILKPVVAEDVQKEIDYIKGGSAPGQTLVTARLYGHAAFFAKDGSRIAFRRRKTLELFALLVHFRGAPLRADEICFYMWKDSDVMLEQNRQYLWKLMGDLRTALANAGAPEVLVHRSGGYSVDMSAVRADLTGRGSLPYLQDFDWAAGGPIA